MSEANKILMRAMIGMFESGDITGATALIATDDLDHQDTRDRSGRDGFTDMIAAVHRLYPDLVVHVDDLIAENDRVAAHLRWSGTYAPAGATFEAESIDIVRFAGGQAVEHWGLSAGWPPASSTPPPPVPVPPLGGR